MRLTYNRGLIQFSNCAGLLRLAVVTVPSKAIAMFLLVQVVACCCSYCAFFSPGLEVKTLVHSQTQNKAQWLDACGLVSASSQSLRFILSLKLYSGFITSRPGFVIVLCSFWLCSHVAERERERTRERKMSTLLYLHLWRNREKNQLCVCVCVCTCVSSIKSYTWCHWIFCHLWLWHFLIKLKGFKK